jgi:SAM-dependent methyltransferase/uncharacterized protein YbaR (Trm112 family)
MRAAVVDRLRCPACSGSPLRHEILAAGRDDEIATGLLWCPHCGAWFPVEDGILELVHGSLAYAQDRLRFATLHRSSILKCGLEVDAVQADAGLNDLVGRQQAHFDWYAENAEQTYSDYEATPFWKAVDQIVFSEWRQGLQPGASLLDIACAQGRSTAPWLDLDLEIFAFDISKPLVLQARNRIRAAPRRVKVDFFVADASQLPFVDSCFDYVVTYGVLHHLPDPASSCGEIARLLRPGGRFFACENNKTVFRRLFDYLQSLWPQWHEEAGAELLISDSDLRKWSKPFGLSLDTRTMVFLPPHLLNLLGKRVAESLLRITDGVLGRLPILKRQGGLILAKGVKTRDPGDTHHEADHC